MQEHLLEGLLAKEYITRHTRIGTNERSAQSATMRANARGLRNGKGEGVIPTVIERDIDLHRATEVVIARHTSEDPQIEM